MPRCVIFTAGDQHGIEKHEIGLRHDDFVICCDAGYRLAQRLSVRPNLLLGDFDSYTGALPEDIPVRRYIRDKDDTDTVIAVRYALEQGYDSILLVAATGGRLDHLLGNLQILAFISEHARTSGSGCWMEAASPFRASRRAPSRCCATATGLRV